MRLCASVLAIAVLSPLSAFAQAPADQPPAGAPPAPPPPAPVVVPDSAPPPMAPPPAAPVVVAAPAPAAAAPAPTWKDLITVGGLVDAYYLYNFSGTGNNSSLISPAGAPVAVRSFDVNSNAFTLNYAKVSVGVAPKPVGLQIDLGYGATGQLINAGAPQAAGAAAPGVTPFLVEQAYATSSFGNLTLDFGKFTTWAGAEVIESSLNFNYSRSIMFFYIPLLHNGIRAAYQVTPELAVKVAAVNGWNDIGFEGDNNPAKTFGFEVAYVGPDTTSVYLNGYFGKEAPGANVRSLVDIVASRSFGPLTLNLNIDYIHEKGSVLYDDYFGVSAMGKFVVNDHFALAARGEYVKFSAPAVGDTPHVEEGTITGIVPLGGRMEIRGEVRGDFANGNDFIPTPLPSKKQQFTGTLAFLAWF